VTRLHAFLRLSRPSFLAGGFVGGALGTAVAAFERGTVDWRAYVVVQLTLSSLHLMVHYANDYFDRESDRLTVRTDVSGGSGALVDGSLEPKVAIVSAYVCLALGIAGIVAQGILGMRAASVICALVALFAWWYSAPPVRLLSRGLGELDTTLVVAILLPLAAYAAQTQNIDRLAVASVLPGAAAIFAMMLCVEVPDQAPDAATGKHNLVVRFDSRAISAAIVVAVAAVAIALILAVLVGAPRSLLIVELVAIPTAIQLIRLARQPAAEPARLARSGVSFFFLVQFLAVAGFLAAFGE
jgi:1,4-dihydroxy-2-naphthoate octaprenyltransferase